MPPARPQSRTKLLDAALGVFRAQGYAASTVDDICAAAGLSKGSFFHYFDSKEALAIGAIAHWNETTGGFFAGAPYQQAEDPRDRVLGYLDFRADILLGELPEFTCLLGTLVQETYGTHPAIRAACDDGLSGHIAALARDIDAAKKRCAPDAPWSAESAAHFIQAVLQGSFIFAKAQQGPAVARENIAHLRRYVESLLAPPSSLKEPSQ